MRILGYGIESGTDHRKVSNSRGSSRDGSSSSCTVSLPRCGVVMVTSDREVTLMSALGRVLFFFFWALYTAAGPWGMARHTPCLNAHVRTTTTTTTTTQAAFPQECPFLRHLSQQLQAVDITDVDSASRRRLRRLRQFLRHDRLSVAVALAESTHH